MSAVLTITYPEGDLETIEFDTADEAQAFADGMLAAMDTSEARETSFEIGWVS